MARVFTDYQRVRAMEKRIDLLENIVIMGNWEGTSIMIEIQRLQTVTDGLVKAIDDAMVLLANLRENVEAGGATQAEIDAVSAKLEEKKEELVEATTPSDTGGSMGGISGVDTEAEAKSKADAAEASAKLKAEVNGGPQA